MSWKLILKNRQTINIIAREFMEYVNQYTMYNYTLDMLKGLTPDELRKEMTSFMTDMHKHEEKGRISMLDMEEAIVPVEKLLGELKNTQEVSAWDES